MCSSVLAYKLIQQFFPCFIKGCLYILQPVGKVRSKFWRRWIRFACKKLYPHRKIIDVLGKIVKIFSQDSTESNKRQYTISGAWFYFIFVIYMYLAPSTVGYIQHDSPGGFYNNFTLSSTHFTPTLGLYKVRWFLYSKNASSLHI